MSEQLLTEDLITILNALELIPGKPGPATGARIIHRGARGQDGEFHKLETIKVCRKRWTSVQAVHRWIAAINTPAKPFSAVSQKTRARQKISARDELAELLEAS